MYHIRPDYQHRTAELYFNDLGLEDQWQDEVYQYARQVYEQQGSGLVFDLGCGSGYKLIKYFQDADTVGLDLEPTVQVLKSRYPQKKWTSDRWAVTRADLIIAADVLEHLLDPDSLVKYMLSLGAKDIVISTPDRDLTVKNWGHPELGPSPNPYHVREWNRSEFHSYVSQYFDIVDHVIIRPDQCTQMIHARPRST